MIDDHSDFSNFTALWREIGLDRTGDSLFLFYHTQRWKKSDFEKFRGWRKSSRIFLLDAEALHGQICDCLESDARIYYFDSTIIDRPRFFTYLWWFDWVRQIDSCLNLTARLVPPALKNCDMMFDALTGTPRENKNFVNRMIDSRAKKTDFLIGSRNPFFITPNSLGMPDDWIAGGDFNDGTNSPLFSDQQRANVSCFVPYEIYNQTWYSITAESRSNGIPFFTEKTARPLIARRLFVMFSTHRFLSHLRSLGFETFGEVLDESYDDIEDNTARWSAAWQQVEHLMLENPKLIYEKIKPILDHNYHLMSRTDHRGRLIETIKNLIDR